MDKLAEEPDDARYEITDALESLRSIYRENSSAFILQLFFDAKSDEITKIYSEAFPNEQARIIKTLIEIDPSRSSKYQYMLNNQKWVMIKKLHINNYALFKNVEIDFTDGFTVISGDTGAGKSIMLDALSLVLGKRVDRFAESSATQKSIIEAEFLLNDSHKKFFNDNDIDFDQETIIRREISINGKVEHLLMIRQYYLMF